VGWRENGKRKRTFFETEEPGKTWADQKQIELENHGIKAPTMFDDLRVMAIAGAEKLAPFGKTIGDLVDHYVRDLQTLARSCTVQVYRTASAPRRVSPGRGETIRPL